MADEQEKKTEEKKTGRKPKGGVRITKETAAEMGRRGGLASRENARRKKELKEAMALMLSLPAVGRGGDMLKELGYDPEDQTNASVVAAKLFQMAAGGDIKAMELVLDYGFKVSDDDRKTREANARISAMEKNGVDVSVNSTGEEGGVVIYLPAIEEESEEEVAEENNDGE